MTRSRKRRKLNQENAHQTASPAFSPVPSAAAVRYFRLLSSGLWSAEAVSPTGEALCSAHFGLQAQEADAVLLTIFNRQHGVALSRTALSARYLRETGAVVRAWGQRGTLHMYSPTDWPIAMGAVRARLEAATESRLSQCATSRALNDAVSAELERVLRAGKEVDTSIVAPLAQEMGAGADIAASVRRYPFLHATERGAATRVTRGTSDASRLVLAPWRGSWEQVDEHNALCEAARRYFAVYGPAEEMDFRYWMGIKAGTSRAAVEYLLGNGELVRVAGMDGNMLVASGEAERRLAKCAREVSCREEWPVRLLGRFDPYLLPHRSKSWLVGENARKRVWTKNADIVPTVIVHGRIRGMWSRKRKGESMDVLVTLFEQEEDEDTALTQREMKLVEEEVARVVTKFWGLANYRVEICQEGADGETMKLSTGGEQSAKLSSQGKGKTRSARSRK